VKVQDANTTCNVAALRQSFAAGSQNACTFAQVLKNAAGALLQKAAGADESTDGSQTHGNASPVGSQPAGGTSTTGTQNSNVRAAGSGEQMELKLNEAIAVAFVAPLLAQAVQNIEQKYFLHSPAEQAYARQMYMEIASRIGTSGKMPLAKNIVKAMLQQMGQADWTPQEQQAQTPADTDSQDQARQAA